MEENLPLVYLHGVLPGKYVATWPVFIVRDRPDILSFSIAVDDADHLGLAESGFIHGEAGELRREYVTAVARRRLHRAGFPGAGVGRISTSMCVCRLKHDELLDAATSSPTPSRKESRWSATVCPSAACTTPPSIGSSWGCAPTT